MCLILRAKLPLFSILLLQKVSNLHNLGIGLITTQISSLEFSSASKLSIPSIHRFSGATASLEICQSTLRIDIAGRNTYLKFGLLLDTLLTAYTRQHHPGYPSGPTASL